MSNATKVVQIAFPPQDANLFSLLAKTPAEEKFFVENRALGIAELGLGICKSVPAGTPVEFKHIGEKTPAIFFCAIPFQSTENPSAHIAKWQISLHGNATKIVRNIAANEEIPSQETLSAEYKNLLNLRPDERAFPQLQKAKEVGGDWYYRACENAIDAISCEKLKKVVLARALDFSAETQIPATPILEKLRERFAEKNCTIFLFQQTPREIFLGATPEMLLRIKNGILETEAIAGSIANSGNDAKTLAQKILSDDKELREHRVVVDFIAEKLAAAQAEIFQIPETPGTLVLPNVIHLQTRIRAKISAGTTALDIQKRLHPTPAMCGVPAQKALDFIVSTEPFPRENFAGPLGFYTENGDGFFAVGIRCAKICGNEIRIYAGSGLVAGSVPAREFSEINAKFAAIKSLLCPAEK